ncbi:unnamed protein product [Brassica oleracea]
MTVDKEQEKDDLLPFYQINQENKEEEEEVVESRLRYEAINRALLTHLSHTHFFKQCTIRKKKKMSSSVSPSHNVFVYGSFQEPAVVGLILECTPVIVSAQLHGLYCILLHISDLPFGLD